MELRNSKPEAHFRLGREMTKITPEPIVGVFALPLLHICRAKQPSLLGCKHSGMKALCATNVNPSVVGACLAGERGIVVSHTAIYRWIQTYALQLEKLIRW